MYAVNGPTSSHGSESRAQGFIIDVKGSGEIVSVFIIVMFICIPFNVFEALGEKKLKIM
jgi:hypothetical protein